MNDASPGRRILRRAAATVRPAVRRWWRKRIIRTGTDVTAASATRSALVLAPHPDDEAIGCAATILHKLSAGTPVRVIVATDGRYSHRSAVVSPDELARLRAAESAAACAALGLGPDQLIFLAFEEGTLEARHDDVVAALATVIADFDPDEVLVTSRLDWHPDHRALARAAEEAVRQGGRDRRLFEFPIWYWADGPWLPTAEAQSVTQAVRRLITAPLHRPVAPELVAIGPLRGRKRDALLTYRTQTVNVTGEPDWATFDQQFLDGFLGDFEVFFPVSIATRAEVPA